MTPAAYAVQTFKVSDKAKSAARRLVLRLALHGLLKWSTALRIRARLQEVAPC